MERTIVLNRVLMHMMDMEHHEVLFSDGFVELNPTSLEYYDKKLEKIFYHPQLKEIEVGNFASIILLSKQMLEDDEKYLEHSKIITREWFDLAALIQDMPNANLLFMDTRVDGDDYMVILKLNYKVAPCMVQETDEEGHEVMRISQRQSVPSKSQNVEEAILVNTSTSQVFLIEKKFMIDGKMDYYLNAQYLKGEVKMTDKEKLGIMKKSIQKVDRQYHVNEFEPSVLIKQALTDCLVDNKDIKPAEIASKIFERDYGAAEECLEMMADMGVGNDDVVTLSESVEKMAKCKIVTDTDVEVVMLVEDYLNSHHVRKIHNEDGTISLLFDAIHEIVVK